MPILIGIDEAGYGPNLGPLLQAAVAIPVAEFPADEWTAFADTFRNAAAKRDDRWLVDDSKVIFSGGEGLDDLGATALGLLATDVAKLGKLLPQWACVEQLRGECWYTGSTPLTPPPKRAERPYWCRAVVTPTPEFNRLTEAGDSKAAATAAGLATLLRAAREQFPDEPLSATVDQQGGRRYYAAFLQDCFPQHFVSTVHERPASSRYQIGDLTVTFRPKADSAHPTVALASMACKYLRELLMGEFNAFWADEVPGLRPTAGYPNDARRFFEAIRPALVRLGLTEAAVWRQR